jgi:LPXTG-motif cell wall-anchored protein
VKETGFTYDGVEYVINDDDTVSKKVNGSTEPATDWTMVRDGSSITNSALGSLKLKKIVTVDGAADTASTDAAFTFTIAGKADTATADISKTVVITLNNGEYTATIADQGGAPAALEADGGYFEIADLPQGVYTITEAEVIRAGYVLETKFAVNGGAAEKGSSVEITLDGTTQTATVDCTNAYTPGVVLPSTGGTGTAAYSLTGTALMLASLWLHLRRRKEQMN